MSIRRVKTSGWAAFDPNKLHNHVTNKETHDDPFPPFSNITRSPLHQCENRSRNGNLVGKSFSSVLAHSPSELIIIPNEDTNRGVLMEKDVSRLYQKLEELHPWANNNVVEDIMAAVDNDIDKASSLLKEMAPKGSLRETKSIENVELLDGHNSLILDHNVLPGFLLDLSMIPVEPELEYDDVYVAHRKEAIKYMRLASRHSKAATEAYFRSDHAAAQELSLKAREEWSNAEKLNAKAAKEILAIRNCENDDWKLDLHGLHASEAVQVLAQHLLKIESTKPYKLKNSVKHPLPRPRLLQVITGIGNHSRQGEASLPVAIKNFLTEKRYDYSEPRDGVLKVKPKFR
ncbi:uncharacterized protein [Rutidosis leptorrhynchoides]|uniref:uncharacterized protein isoform X2 n=1 Tax=Rutidosis leptorrhynchoides TaxID=125765 RepID=UPI003A992034